MQFIYDMQCVTKS